MNKTAIKNFAVWARKKLIADITYQAGLLGVTETGAVKPLPQSTRDMQFFDIGTKDYAKVSGRAIDQRNKLVEAIREREADGSFAAAFKAVVEEVAYTWFNRLIAIRFMEVNDYLPSRVRVLSSENPAKAEPDFVTTPFEAELDLSPAEQEDVLRLKDENKLDELFRMLFIKQCNKLHEILPQLFEETDDYTELLLTISFTDQDGVVWHLVHDIEEKDFNVEQEGQVEIIGWLYQYYNTEPKDETFALLKKNVKITKERIPSATQLFTPDWIVRYMVENSLGRLWVEGHPNAGLQSSWKYYLEEAEQEPEVQVQLAEIRREYASINPEDIKVIDPCMGSGHILVYCFDVLMQIYESQGYTQRDAAQCILTKNLFGLDIDKRAAQLSYFAVMMKARQYDRRVFTRGIDPHVYAIQESNGINRAHLKYLGWNMAEAEKAKARSRLNTLLKEMEDAKEYGSILNISQQDWELLYRFVGACDFSGQMELDAMGLEETQQELFALIQQGAVMAQKYDVVVTNPPYMGSSGMSPRLSQFVKDNYPDTKSDLFACFIEKGFSLAKRTGYISMITMESWMFLSSFEKMRQKITSSKNIVNMVHMPYLGKGGTSLGINFGTAAVVFEQRKIPHYLAQYDYVCYYETDEDGVPFEFPVINERYKTASLDNFSKIPGSPVAYWVGKGIVNAFSCNKSMSSYGKPVEGLKTGDNDRFLRYWFEVNRASAHLVENDEPDAAWRKMAKGGPYRRWYGNMEYVCRWGENGEDLRAFPRASLSNEHLYFTPALTWTYITSGTFSMRTLSNDTLYNNKGPACYVSEDLRYYLLGLMNCCVVGEMLGFLAPTIDCKPGNIADIPVIIHEKNKVENIVKECAALSKSEWDSFETSWDFKRHPLV